MIVYFQLWILVETYCRNSDYVIMLFSLLVLVYIYII
jgi:hypothetical protein